MLNTPEDAPSAGNETLESSPLETRFSPEQSVRSAGTTKVNVRSA